MRTIKQQKLEMLKPLAEEEGMTLKDYILFSAEADTDFFRFILDERLDNDFDMDLTEEEKQEFINFVNSL